MFVYKEHPSLVLIIEEAPVFGRTSGVLGGGRRGDNDVTTLSKCDVRGPRVLSDRWES